jgi:hypothetical protein
MPHRRKVDDDLVFNHSHQVRISVDSTRFDNYAVAPQGNTTELFGLSEAFSMLRCINFVLPLFIFSLALSGQNQLSGRNDINSSLQSLSPIRIVAPLFVQDEAFGSYIGIVNTSAGDTYARVILRAQTGAIIIRKQVSLAPHAAVHLAVRDLRVEVNSAETIGSAIVEQSPALSGKVVLAQLSMTYQRGAAQASYIDENLRCLPLAVRKHFVQSRLIGLTGH